MNMRLIEGDILLPNLGRRFNYDNPVLLRNAIRNKLQRWHNGIVPYTISPAFPKVERSVIRYAMYVMEQQTCIRFVERNTTDRDYIAIVRWGGCASYVGRIGGRQNVLLAHGCLYPGVIQHELMHAIGFFHEQNRPDRARYVQIKWENIRPRFRPQFYAYGAAFIDNLGEPYDYASLMHYGPTDFSWNSLPTIVAKQPGGEQMGQRDGLSVIDVRKVRKLYDCPIDSP